MMRPVCLRVFALALVFCALLNAEPEDAGVVFRSDVSLIRVDAQVIDRNNRAVTGLTAEDFILREEGQPQTIRNFSSEEMPVDVLLLLDVSGSMRPHIERVASAADQALRVLADDDRVAIMVFDRRTRVRLPFRNSRESVERELNALLQQETFDGGTDVHRGLLDAGSYVARNARRDARRAIVILTDDQSERGRDKAGVLRSMAGADAVLSVLLAPDTMWNQSRSPRTGPRPAGGGWPAGGPLGGPLGDIIFGRGGRRSPGPVVIGGGTEAYGSPEIARETGGDSLSVDDASALETTLRRIRQRYALHFYLPAGVRPGEERSIDVQLSDAASRRYSGADVRFRRVYLTPTSLSDGSTQPVEISQGQVDTPPVGPPVVNQEPPGKRRRRTVNERDGTGTGGPSVAAQPADGGWRRVDESVRSSESTTEAESADKVVSEPQPRRGWRRVQPGEQP